MLIHQFEQKLRIVADKLYESYPFSDLYLINDTNKQFYLGKESATTLRNLNITRFSSLKYDYKCIKVKLILYENMVKYVCLQGTKTIK
jgi:hypothetical protein